MLDLEHDADAPAAAVAHEIEHVPQAQHRFAVVVRRTVGPEVGKAFPAAQGRQFIPDEVLDEPTGPRHPVDRLGGAPVGELRALRHVGGSGDLVLVPHHEHAVARDDDVRLDRVDAPGERELIRRPRVFGAIAGRAAVADHEGTGHGIRLRVPGPRPRIRPGRSIRS